MYAIRPAIAALAGALVFAAVAHAQVPLSAACQTQFGVCPAPTAPVGAPCVCGPGHPGRMIFMSGGGSMAPQPAMSRYCGTQFGACPTPFAAPVGSPCGCGVYPGRMLP